MKTLNAKLNKRERRAAQLLAHYQTCERLAVYLAIPARMIDGKKISVSLFHIERDAHNAAIAQCNGERFGNQPYRTQDEWNDFEQETLTRVAIVFLYARIPGLFLNQDARGYALKIDNDTPEGLALIRAVGLHADMGGYGILSPEIDGN